MAITSLPLPPATGTITLTTNSATVTGTGTAFKSLEVGDLLLTGQSVVVIGEKPTANGSATLALSFAGITESDVVYQIVPRALGAQAAYFFQLLNLNISSQEGQLVWLWSAATEGGDPGASKVQINSAAWASATALHLSNIDEQTNDLGAWLATWAGSKIRLTSLSRPSVMGFATIGTVTEGTGYQSMVLSDLVGAPNFQAGERLAIVLMPAGTKGDKGDTGATGAKGDKGDTGWSPQTVIVPDGDRLVEQLLGYVGGEGTAPTANVGEYVGADGYKVLIGDAVDVRGGTGPQGLKGDAGNDGALSLAHVEKTANYTLLAADTGKTFIANSADPVTFTFEPAATLGATWGVPIKNEGAGLLVLSPNGAETIDGESTLNLEQGESLLVSCDGTELRSLFTGGPGGSGGGEAGSIVSGGLNDNDIVQALAIAENSGAVLQLPSGFVDAFADESMVDGAASTNAVYDVANKKYTAGSAGDLIDGAVGTNIGNLTSGGGLAAAFDGGAAVGWSGAANKLTAGAGYIGKTYSSGRRISKVDIGSTTTGWDSSAGTIGTYDLRLYGKVGAAPANATDGTLLAQNSAVGDPASVTLVELISNDTSTAFDHVWVYTLGDLNPAAYGLAIDYVGFYEYSPADISLVSNAKEINAQSDIASGFVHVAENEAITPNADLTFELSRDDGVTWTAGVLELLVTQSGGTKLYSAPNVDLSGQPAGTAMRYRIKTLNNKNIDIIGAGLVGQKINVLGTVVLDDFDEMYGLLKHAADGRFLVRNGGFDAFADTSGVDVAGATNLDTSTAGVLKPALVGTTVVQTHTLILGTYGSLGYTYLDRGLALTAGDTVNALGVYLATAATISLKIGKRNSPGNYDIVVSESFDHPGGGFAYKTLSTPFVVPAGDEYSPGVWVAGDNSMNATNTARALKSGDLTGAGIADCIESDGTMPIIGYIKNGVVQNMTAPSLVIPYATQPAKLSTLIELDEIGAVTINTNVMLDVSLDGATWLEAPLAPHSEQPNGRKVYSADVDVSSLAGSSIFWRVRTLGVDVGVHGVGVRSAREQVVAGGSGSSVAASGRNRIVNPCMQVSQEFGDNLATSSSDYPVDQWQFYFQTDGAVAAQRVQSVTPAGAQDRLRISVTTADATLAAGQYLEVWQRIEGSKIADLMFGTANARDLVLRFGFKGPAGTYGVAFQNAALDRSFLREFTISAGEANTDTLQEVSFPGDISGVWLTGDVLGAHLTFGLAGGTNYQGIADQWIAADNFTTATASNGLASNANVFEIFDVGLKLDPTGAGVYGSFEVPDLRAQEAECGAYFNKIPIVGFSPFFGIAYGSTAALVRVEFPNRMRAAPAVTLPALSNDFTFLRGDGGYPSAFGSVALSSVTNSGFTINQTGATGFTVGQVAPLYSSSGTSIIANARL